MILYHDILVFVIFALQVVLPVNPKMHLDVTLDDIFEDKQEICKIPYKFSPTCNELCIVGMCYKA